MLHDSDLDGFRASNVQAELVVEATFRPREVEKSREGQSVARDLKECG